MLVGIVCPSMNRRPVAPTGAAAGAPAGQSAPAASDEAAEPATNGYAGVLAVPQSSNCCPWGQRVANRQSYHTVDTQTNLESLWCSQ